MMDSTVQFESRAEQFPIGARLRLAELERYDNAALLAELRRHEPVTWFAEQDAWLVTTKSLIDQVQNAPDRFVVEVGTNPQRLVLGNMMLGVDGDEHKRHRAPFAAPFKLGAVRRGFTDVIMRNVDTLLSEFENDGEAELADAFANPFAVNVASDIIGLGFEHAAEVHEIYGRFAAGMVGYQDAGAVAAAQQAGERLQSFLMESVDRLRAEPDDSMLSSVVNAEADVRLSDEEMYANLRVILFGAIETVQSMILNTAWALLHHPEQLQALERDPSLWPAAVQEGLRWVPPVGYSDRWTVAPTELGGVVIPEGEYVIAAFASANRDPEVFSNPERFDIERGEVRSNLSFGKGIHMCLGVNLARLQGQLALQSLFQRLPQMRLDPQRPAEPVGFNFRRPPHLHVTWSSGVM
jgi:cytochrome P450